MWQAVILSFLAAVLAVNSVPHFVKGVTKEPFPTFFGTSPVVNFVLAWPGFILAGLCLYWAHVPQHALPAAVAGSVGGLVMGLLHATHGAVGPEGKPAVAGGSAA